MFDKLKEMNWQKYSGRGRVPDINLMLCGLMSSVLLIRQRAHSDLIDELDIAYGEGQDLGIAIVPFLLEMITHPEVVHKSIIIDILIHLTSYLHPTLQEPFRSHATRIRDAVCNGETIYLGLVERNEIVDDAIELLEICR